MVSKSPLCWNRNPDKFCSWNPEYSSRNPESHERLESSTCTPESTVSLNTLVQIRWCESLKDKNISSLFNLTKIILQASNTTLFKHYYNIVAKKRQQKTDRDIWKPFEDETAYSKKYIGVLFPFSHSFSRQRNYIRWLVRCDDRYPNTSPTVAWLTHLDKLPPSQCFFFSLRCPDGTLVCLLVKCSQRFWLNVH